MPSPNFSNYNLDSVSVSERGVYGLADGLLPEMAAATGFDMGTTPSEEELRRFIGHIGPKKTLQDNIEQARELLGTNGDAVQIAADWVERSGVMMPYRSSFRDPSHADALSEVVVDTAVWNSCVGRWNERRAQALLKETQFNQIGKVVILAGTRQMGESEHDEVARIASREGELPTETQFTKDYIAPWLQRFGIETNVIAVESTDGDEIFRQGLGIARFVLDGTVLAVGNAPATIQVTGQLRYNARKIVPSFDDSNRVEQLFMLGDTIPVARQGESPKTHQNPLTALGQIARDAYLLHLNV